jgi:hypothetical protein
MPPSEEDGLSLKEAAKRLSEHRHQRETDRAKLNAAIGLDDEPGSESDLQAHYREMKEAVKRTEDALGIKDERSEKIEELRQAQNELRSQLAEQRQSAPLPEVERVVRQSAEAGRQQIAQAFLSQYPEAWSPQAFAQLEANNPTRAAQARQLYAQCEGVYRQHLNEIAQAVPQHLEWRKAQDTQFDQAHPEMRDPKVKGEIRDAAVRVLKKAGATDADIDQLRVNGLPYVAQEMLAKAAKYELALEAKARNAGRRNTPPRVQKPGVAGVVMSRADSAAQAASRAMDQNPSAKNAARMLSALRRSRG